MPILVEVPTTSELKAKYGNNLRPQDPNGLATESWAEGFMFASLFIMATVTVANMKRKALLHKLILIELIFGTMQGLNIFLPYPYYGFWIGVGGIFLNTSWSLHNVISWMKNRPFLSQKASMFYIGTVGIAQVYWVVEMTAVFLYFTNHNDNLFPKTRPYEPLFRDPWWIFTCCSLVWNIKSRYGLTFRTIFSVSPRFAVMLLAMILSLTFIILDLLASLGVLLKNSADGVNPFWKLSFIFKCLTDTMILDDFKTALDKLKNAKFNQFHTVGGSPTNTTMNTGTVMDTARGKEKLDSETAIISVQQTFEVVEESDHRA